MISLIAFIFTIGILVFFHELGHYLAARSVGVKVEKFYIYTVFPKKRRLVTTVYKLVSCVVDTYHFYVEVAIDIEHILYMIF